MRKPLLVPGPVEANAAKRRPRPSAARRRLAPHLAAWSLPVALVVVPATGRASTLAVASFADLAQRCGPSVAPATLAAIAKTESNFRPLVVSDNTTRRARDFESAEDAAALADTLISHGHSVDLGLMQINSANLRRLGYTTRDALDACRSVAGGALILSRNYASTRKVADAQVALRHALSQYNTGNSWAGFRNGYVRRVEQAARMLLAGSATPAPGATLAHAAGPLSRDIAGARVGWNVWDGITYSIGLLGAARSESFLVF